MADVASPQYPQPPAPGAGMLNPLQAIGLVNAVTQLRTSQADLASKQATGAAYQNALNPDGSVDQAKLSATLQGDPAAAYGMPETASRMLQQSTAQTDLDAKRNGFIVDALGATADDPKLSLDKVRSLAVTLGRNLRLPASQVNNWLDGLPKGREALRGELIKMRNLAIGSAGSSTPTDTGLTPEGAPIVSSRGGFNYATAGGGLPKGLAPGEAGVMESSAGRAAALQSTASTSPQYRADLANLKQMSQVLDIGGPTVPYEKKFAQLAQRFGLPSTLTPDQLTSVEEFDKTANAIALRQGASLGGTDASRVLSVGSTPSSSMSRLGRQGVVSMLEGSQDFIDHAREQWLEARAAGASASQHDQWMHSFGKNYDPRVFQFARMDRTAKQKFIDTLSPAEIPAFEQSFKNAAAHGWVEPLTREGK
jgi:hypothetical protein